MTRFFLAMQTLWPDLIKAPLSGQECFKVFDSRLANITPRDFNARVSQLSANKPTLAGYTYTDARTFIDNVAPVAFGEVFAAHRPDTTA